LVKEQAANSVCSIPYPSIGEFIHIFLSLDGRWSGQASSEDLFPLGYGERERLGEGETGDNPPPSNSLPPGEGEYIYPLAGH
jgi:hypothetical protein